MRIETIYQNEGHKWIFIGRDEAETEVIDTNQYAIINGDDVFLMDPGGAELFPEVMTKLSQIVDIKNIKGIFSSHQDPDIISALPYWISLCPDATIYCSGLWRGFIAHYGHEYIANMVSVPDEGIEIPLGDAKIELIPAHYCHSSANFSLFDHKARVLFSGDIGGAVIDGHYPLYCEDFQKHVDVMKPFHQRLMPSSEALMRWVKSVRKHRPSLICPQHGAIFRSEDTESFLDWLYDLEVGKY